eukprot:6317983-Prymnesium_polylepis.2
MIWLTAIFAMPAPPVPKAPSPPVSNALPAPPPPPPALVAGLRGLLENSGCDTPCRERAEDWFEQAHKWGADSVVSMVRLGLEEGFLRALALPPGDISVLRERLKHVPTTVVPKAEL